MATKASSGLMVHQVLANSYMIYLAAVIVGLILDRVFHPFSVFAPYALIAGVAFILFGTALIYWAQSASSRTSYARNVSADKICEQNFCVGPYVFTRSPTHYGLFFMTLGLAMVYHSLFMILCTLVAFLVTRYFFLPKEEKHLAQKYGEPYLQYKERVRM